MREGMKHKKEEKAKGAKPDLTIQGSFIEGNPRLIGQCLDGRRKPRFPQANHTNRRLKGCLHDRV